MRYSRASPRHPAHALRRDPTDGITRRFALVTLAIGALASTASARADAIDARALAAGCASCHQPSQRTPPPLDRRTRADLLAALHGFRDGTRRGTVMPQLVKGYTEAQLEAVAAYFAEPPLE